jgi:ankyrin repeat protein
LIFLLKNASTDKGDCGSWTVCHDSGKLVGILFAATPDMDEAYLIPATELFDDISRANAKQVTLTGFLRENKAVLGKEKDILRGKMELDQTPPSLAAELGADVDSKDKYGLTPLLRAAQKGHVDDVQQLLNAGAEVESKDKYGRTPLIWAVRIGHDVVVQQLLRAGADVNTKDEFYRTPLMWAARDGHEAIVQLLLEYGAYVDSKDDNYGRTPLMWAAENDHKAVVRQLLDAGANADLRDKYGLKSSLRPESTSSRKMFTARSR